MRNACPNLTTCATSSERSPSHGLELATRADESTTGPASLMLFDPDGNPILIDQHVPGPGK